TFINKILKIITHIIAQNQIEGSNVIIQYCLFFGKVNQGRTFIEIVIMQTKSQKTGDCTFLDGGNQIKGIWQICFFKFVIKCSKVIGGYKIINSSIKIVITYFSLLDKFQFS